MFRSKKLNKVLLLMMLFIPTIVLASEGERIDTFDYIIPQLFASIFIYTFIANSIQLAFNNTEKIIKYIKGYAILRFIVFLIADFTFPNLVEKTFVNNTLIVFFGIIFTFIFAIVAVIKNASKYISIEDIEVPTIDENNLAIQNKTLVKITDFDPIYNQDEKSFIEAIIKKELSNIDILNSNLIPSEILKRKTIFNILIDVLIFTFISMIFFHFPFSTYVIGAIIIFILTKLASKFDLIAYVKKEIESRPNEKISNIVMNIKSSLIEDKQKLLRITVLIISIISPFVIFSSPKIFYEKSNDGYSVRFYAFGLNNMKTAVIPEEHNGLKVTSLRGNAFSNMPLLEEVTLPDTIKEIRGQAFKNDFNLVNVNIPSSLEYLGGGSFYNCGKIKRIILPDSLTFMGGEIFYNATSLEEVRLSNNLEEIRGDSFAYAESLRRIVIPDKVTRIGGHAFLGNTNLNEVVITKNSNLKEIGSSAFRECPKLLRINIPSGTYINDRAFKDSPTNVNYFDRDNNQNNYYNY